MLRILTVVSLAVLAGCGGNSSSGNPDASLVGDGGGGDATTVDAALTDGATPIDATPVDFDAAPTGATALYIFGDFQINNTNDVGRAVEPPGGLSALTFAGVPVDISHFDVSSNGSVLAVAVNDGTGTIVRAYDSDLGNPRTLLTIADPAVQVDGIGLSPDGSYLAFVMDADTDGSRRLHIVPTDASAAATAVNADTGDATLEIDRFVWAHDNARILFRADLVTNNIYGAYIVDAVGAGTPVPAVTGGVASLVGFDSSSRGYFVSEHIVAGEYLLYRVNADGQGLEEVPFTAALTNGDGDAQVTAARFNTSGTKLAFAADSPTKDLYQVFVTSIVSPSPAVVSAVITTILPGQVRGPSRTSPLAWSADETRVAVAADWLDGAEDDATFVLPSSGTPGGTKLIGAPAGGDTQLLSFDMNSTSLFVVGDLLNANASELFHVTDLDTADQTASGLLLQGVPTNGDIVYLRTVLN